MRQKVEPGLLPLKGAQGGLAITNGILGGDFNFRGQTFPMIPDPRFGLGLGIHKACAVSCLSATVDKAVEKFKFFIHVQRLMEAPTLCRRVPVLNVNSTISGSMCFSQQDIEKSALI